MDTVTGTAMLLNISQHSELTLQEQIVSQLRARILSGELEADAPLTSIRALAQTLKVGINTVQRAYDVLLTEELIYARQGKGFFVAPLATHDKTERARRRYGEALRKLIDEARQEGLGFAELKSIFAARLGDSTDGGKE
jgi:GntR family transcriptional regulator